MEIFLLFVVIILLLLLHIIKNSKLNNLETKLSKIEEYLKQVQLYQSRDIAKQEAQIESPVSKIVTSQDAVKPEIIIPPFIPPIEIIPVNEVEPVKIPDVVFQEIDSVEEVNSEQTIVEQTQIHIPQEPEISWYEKFRANNPDLENFIGENILSKVAITILVLGIAFFVKFAIDKEWINEIARVGIGVLCGGIVLGFAHRLRKNFKAFSSVLVAGGIAIFYFTIGIAFHQYHLFNQTTAFLLMLFITGFSVFISIMYNRQELAVLSLIGGFAAPFMVSTGEGNYIVLFTYVLILDVGMLVLAYLRKWNIVNIFAYCLTMILYFGWLQTKVIDQPNAPYKGAFIFSAIFYIVFIMMNMINNIKEKRAFKSFDLSILISNTFLFYGAGMQILNYYHPELQGLFSLLMALFNLILSWLLYKKFKADQKLVYLMIGLTLTFITLVAPVQLNGNYITIFWALESVLLIWLAQRSGIVMYRFASFLIMILMSFSLFMDWSQIYLSYNDFKPAIIFNKAFITGFISSLSFLATGLLLKNETEIVKFAGIRFNPINYSKFMMAAFAVLLYFTGLFELLYQLNRYIYYETTVMIIAGAYHFLYFVLLNIAAKNQQKAVQVTLYVLNYINVCLYVLIFAIIPYFDFQENIGAPERGYLGFIFHYASLACFVLFLYFMRRLLIQPNASIKGSKALRTILVSIAIVYVSSVELILHVSQVVIKSLSAWTDKDLLIKLAEVDIVQNHCVKIGFPILWGLIAFGFLFIGMKKQNKTLRIMSLILIGIILFKLFTYDIEDASEAGKIIAFIILGVVLLIISFMYQKIKKLIIDDERIAADHSNPTNEDPTNL